MNPLSPVFSLIAKFRFLLTPAQRRRALRLLGLMLVGTALETLCAGLVVPVIAVMTQEDIGRSYPQLEPLLARLGHPSQAELVVGAMLGLLGVYLVKNVFVAYETWQQARFAYTVQADVSQRLFAAYLRQPYTFHLQRNSAPLIRNATREASLFTDAMLNSFVIGTELLVLGGISVLLLVLEPVGALLAVAVLTLAATVFYRATRRRMTRWAEGRQMHEAQRIQHLQQGLGGAKEVKLLGREEEFLAQYQAHNVRSARLGELQVTMPQLSRLWLELLAVAALVTLVLTMLAQGKSVGSILPTLGLLAAAAFRLMPSANRVLFMLQMLRYCLPSVNVLHDELRLAGAQPAAAPAARRQGLARDVRFVGVGYTYAGSARPALSELDLRIGKDECVGIIGASGSGKSTLVDVFLGLLTPTQGRVLLDAEDIQGALRAWQDQIGYVPQSIFLTDDTLRRNVAFGIAEDQIDRAALERAIRAARLDEFVASLPQGVDTPVGERGVRLSGGQRQRIGIARALYHDPAVLVLDEATSALDTATERAVMDAVEALQGHKTIVIVAHRFSTVEQCDRLYRLEAGRVVAEGSPSDLLRMPQAV